MIMFQMDFLNITTISQMYINEDAVLILIIPALYFVQ